jgi:hypothetical protein
MLGPCCRAPSSCKSASPLDAKEEKTGNEWNRRGGDQACRRRHPEVIEPLRDVSNQANGIVGQHHQRETLNRLLEFEL